MKSFMALLLCGILLGGCCASEKEKIEFLQLRIAQLELDSTRAHRTIEQLERQKATAERNVVKLEGDIEFMVEEFRNHMNEEGVTPSTMVNEPQLVSVFTRDLAKWGGNTRRLRLDLTQAEQELEEFMSETWVVEMRKRNEGLQQEADQLRMSNSELSSNLRYVRGELNREKETNKLLNDQITEEIEQRQEAEDETRKYKRYWSQERDRAERLEEIASVVTNGSCIGQGTVKELQRDGILININERTFKKDVFQVYFSVDHMSSCGSN